MQQTDLYLGDWAKPQQDNQLSLFTEPRDRVLAVACVSLDDLKRWRTKEWLSFDPDEVLEFHSFHVSEVCFVRNLARSGLTDAQVDALLLGLPRPYRYDPRRVAYSFADGWVGLPKQPSDNEVAAFIEEHLDSWVEGMVRDGASGMLEKLSVRFEAAAIWARAGGSRQRD